MKLARSLSLFLLFSISIACGSNPEPQVDPQSPEERPPEPATIQASPSHSLAGISGATVRITYRIPRHPDNRRFRISWGDEGGEWGATEKSLDGENSPVAFDPFSIHYLGPGSYTVTLTLIRIENGKEKEYREIQKFTVLGDQ